MARHPMSSSWPQLTARTSVSGQSSTTRVSSRGRRADGSVHDHDRPRGAGETYFHAVHGTGALSLWMGVQLRVSSRSHPMPCTAIRFRALLVCTGTRSEGKSAPARAETVVTPTARGTALDHMT